MGSDDYDSLRAIPGISQRAANHFVEAGPDRLLGNFGDFARNEDVRSYCDADYQPLCPGWAKS